MPKETEPKTEWLISSILKDFMTPKSFLRLILRNTILWIVICGLLDVILWIVDYIDFLNSERSLPYEKELSFGTYMAIPYYTTSVWTNWSILIISILGLNIAGANIVYNHAKSHNRNACAWLVGFILFTPILAGIAYLVTWPVPLKR